MSTHTYEAARAAIKAHYEALLDANKQLMDYMKAESDRLRPGTSGALHYHGQDGIRVSLGASAEDISKVFADRINRLADRREKLHRQRIKVLSTLEKEI